MRVIFSFVLLVIFSISHAQIFIIPLPKIMETRSGQFEWTAVIKIYYNNSSLKHLAVFAHSMLSEASGFKLAPPISSLKSNLQSVRLLLDPSVQTNKEGYLLEVTPDFISIKANTENGLFYELQSLVQLIPANGRGL